MPAAPLIVAAKAAGSKILRDKAVREGVKNYAKTTAKNVAKEKATNIVTGKGNTDSVPAPRSGTGQLKSSTAKTRTPDANKPASDSIIEHAKEVAGTSGTKESASSGMPTTPSADQTAAQQAQEQAAAAQAQAQAAQQAQAAAAATQAEQAAQAVEQANQVAASAKAASSDAKAAAQQKTANEAAAKNGTADKASKNPLKPGGLKNSGKGGLLGNKSGKKKKMPGSTMMKAMMFTMGAKIALTVLLLIVIGGAISSCVGVVYGLVTGGGDDEQVIEKKSMVMPTYKKERKTCYVGGESDDESRSYSGLRGSDTPEQVWNFFYDHGFSKECCAGILGNAQQESGIDPACDGGAAKGIFQFEKSTGNAAGLDAFAAERGKDWTDLESQLLYALEALPYDFDTYTGKNPVHYYDNGEWCWWPTAMSFDEYKNVSDVAEATEIFERVHERASIPRMDNRIKYAQEWYDKFKDSTSSSSGSSSSKSSSGGSGGNDGRLILIGDSRTVQMHNYQVGSYHDDISGTTDDGNVWRAKGSMGLEWMETTAVPYAEGQMQKGDNIVILFGVNDISNTSQYVEYINKKAAEWKSSGVNTYFVSVNPVDDAKAARQNSEIDAFNSYAKSNLQGVTWIETNSVMQEKGFSTDAEGLHYGEADYQLIYDTIKDAVANGSSNSGGRVLDEECQDEEEEQTTGYTGGHQSLASANEKQKEIATHAVNDTNVNLGMNFCLGFVQDVFANCGYEGTIPRYCCAHAAMDASTTYDDLSNIPVGACLFAPYSSGAVMCSCGRDAGHIAIYIGDGQVAENVGGRAIGDVDAWIERWGGQGVVKWGWLGGVALA